MGNYMYGIPDNTYINLIEKIETNDDIVNLQYHKLKFDKYSDMIFEKLFEKKRFDLMMNIIKYDSNYTKNACDLFTKYSLEYKFYCSDLIYDELKLIEDTHNLDIIKIDIEYIYNLSDKINTYHLDYYLKYLNIIEYEKLIDKLIVGEKNPELIETILKKYSINLDFNYLISQCILFDNVTILKLLVEEKHLEFQHNDLFYQCCAYDSIKCAKYIHYESATHKFNKNIIKILIENNSLKIGMWIIKMNKNLYDVELFEMACKLNRFDFAKLMYENIKIPIEIINKYE